MVILKNKKKKMNFKLSLIELFDFDDVVVIVVEYAAFYLYFFFSCSL